jgi:hypothetical protein
MDIRLNVSLLPEQMIQWGLGVGLLHAAHIPDNSTVGGLRRGDYSAGSLARSRQAASAEASCPPQAPHSSGPVALRREPGTTGALGNWQGARQAAYDSGANAAWPWYTHRMSSRLTQMIQFLFERRRMMYVDPWTEAPAVSRDFNARWPVATVAESEQARKMALELFEADLRIKFERGLMPDPLPPGWH